MRKGMAAFSTVALVAGLGLTATAAEADPPTVPQQVGWNVTRGSEEASAGGSGSFHATKSVVCEEDEIAVGGTYHYDPEGISTYNTLEVSVYSARFANYSHLWNGEGLPQAYEVALVANADGTLYVDAMCAEAP